MPKSLKLVLASVLLLAAAGGAFVWWFFKDDAPAEVDLGAAVASVDDDAETGTGGVEGTWSVDADSGSFDFSDTASGTFVGFRVEEELTSVGSTTAVGRTPEVDGELTILDTSLEAATFEADMTAITTNESRRDSRVQSALDTGEFPTATFTLTEAVDLGAAAEAGGPVSVAAAGELTIKGVTNDVVIDLEAQLVDGTIVVVGSMPIVFADYGVSVPSAPVVVSAEDNGILEVQLLLTQG